MSTDTTGILNDITASAGTDRAIVIGAGIGGLLAARALAGHFAEVVVLDGPRVDPTALLDILEERGLRRIECEGGPTFLNELLAAGLVDEADITVSPTFSGTGHSPQTSLLPAVAEFHLVQVLLKDGFLMNRYLKEQP